MIFILWLFIWLFSIIHPFLNGIYLITFLEYESNHISSISLCRNMNVMTSIEIFSHLGVIVLMFIFFKHTWIALLINAPIVLYHLIRIYDRSYLLDATELYKEIRPRKREAILKIVFYIILFAVYVFSFIRAVILFEKSLR